MQRFKICTYEDPDQTPPEGVPKCTFAGSTHQDQSLPLISQSPRPSGHLASKIDNVLPAYQLASWPRPMSMPACRQIEGIPVNSSMYHELFMPPPVRHAVMYAMYVIHHSCRHLFIDVHSSLITIEDHLIPSMYVNVLMYM